MENDTRSEDMAKPENRPSNHAEHFAAQIVAEGYSHGSVAKYGATAQALWSAIEAAKLGPDNLTDHWMNKLAKPIIKAASAKDQQHCRYRLRRFRDYLIKNANAPARVAPPLGMFLSRMCSGLSTHLGSLSFEGQGTFTTRR